jgi:hypothetical protein
MVLCGRRMMEMMLLYRYGEAVVGKAGKAKNLAVIAGRRKWEPTILNETARNG